ncbi:putative short-chain dehydrogenase [Boeremia exigua]|uniref:putative short-chain dehydrogenase n=1 Tax=Boeremia exigua TaxID=749465 RepID=UPI001E8DC958|nr:putative short-chain dehydrogenase [Boeremia exigua]KAH6613090.1 putative short-chain dehydrogenase [Boeremia exigua]
MSKPLPYNRQTALASRIASDNAAHITGKVILTTGVTLGGLGATFVFEIAKYNPALLILAGRNASKIQSVIDKLRNSEETINVQTKALVLDLSSQQNVRNAAKEVLESSEQCIDVLVNSAGLMGGPYRKTEEGIELQFGSNYLGHWLFTNLIMPKLLAAKHPRVVNVSSGGHRYGGIRFEDWNFEDGKTYNQWVAYGQSKTGNVLFSKALARKLGSRGLQSYSLHPGVNLETSLSGAVEGGFSKEDIAELEAMNKKLGWTEDFDMKDLDECAATHVAAAFDPRLKPYNGAYLEDGNVSDRLQPTATNPEDIDKLWKLSEKLVGQEFDY